MAKKYYAPKDEKNLKMVRALCVLFGMLGIPYAWAIGSLIYNSVVFLVLASFVGWPLFMYLIYWVIKRG